jgi:hypothetical protein
MFISEICWSKFQSTGTPHLDANIKKLSFFVADLEVIYTRLFVLGKSFQLSEGGWSLTKWSTILSMLLGQPKNFRVHRDQGKIVKVILSVTKKNVF